MSATTLDPRTVPLSGLQLIEASAGTGKTFNLAGLYLRLIVERGASVREILVMTFTKAATQELRERIRRRLVDAAYIAADASAVDDDNPEHAFARDVIEAVIESASEKRERLARRLADAAAGVDEAVIVTIHGFAQRAATENAFDSAQAFDRGDLVDDRSVFREVTEDVWRQTVIGASGRSALFDVWPTPDALHKDVAPILSRPRIVVDDADDAGLANTYQTLGPLWQREKQELEAALEACVDASAFKKSGMQNLLAAYDTPVELVALLDARLAEAFETGEPAVLPEALAELADPKTFIAQNSKAKKACGETFKNLAVCTTLATLVSRARLVRTTRAAAQIRTLAEQRKAAWRQFSYDDLVAALHNALADATHGPPLAAALRDQWPYALVDEFQDTDPLQYASLARIYLQADNPPADDTALLLIGDPKQAIYAFRGGDIYAYLAAARAAGDRQYTLGTNYRSSPAVCSAIAALFATPEDRPFLEDGIDFPPVAAGRAADDHQLVYPVSDNTRSTHPALTVWQFTGGSGTKGDDESAIIHRTVVAIASLLAGEARWDSDDPKWQRAVAPSDIAILVNANREAARLQIALAEHGISAVCQRRDSIFATDEAHDLALLLAAVARPDDVRAVKSAEATRLAGGRLADIAALAEDDVAMQACVSRYQTHHQRWRKRGVLTALEAVFIAAGPTILALTDGERRMSNYLQLGEQLAEAEPECYGMDSLVHWLDRAIADADGGGDSSEESQLRLESDDALVRIATVHASKGLEYPIVFMPFAMFLGAPSGARDPSKPPYVYHDVDSVQPEQARIDLIGTGDKSKQRAVREFHAEALRLLYVGLTRAADALFISWREPGDGTSKKAPGQSAKNTALDQLLGRDKTVSESLTTLAHEHADIISLETINTGTAPTPVPTVTASAEAELTSGRCDLPARRTPWSTYSFSRLAHAAPETQSAELPEPGADDERTDPASDAEETETETSDELPTLDPRLSGVRFGSAVHDLLETNVGNSNRPRWPKPGEPLSDDQRETVARHLRQYGLIDESTADPRVDDTASLIARTLHTPLPEIGPLAALDPKHCLAEMEFMLRLGGSRLDRLIETLRTAGYLPAALGGNPASTLYGLMQGFIDLIVEVDGRYIVIDYKTNRLGDTPAAYRAEALQHAIGRAHYDLQYLIYTVALHRHLKRCLGSSYDPAAHLGGVQYLFVRAMDGETTSGVFSDRPDVELIEALDVLFDNVDDSREATA